METPQIRIQVGNVSLTVPTCVDEKTTHEIARRVTESLKAIEKKSDRIDTQAFALQTAYQFAAEVERLQREAKEDTRELLLALDRVHAALRSIIEVADDAD